MLQVALTVGILAIGLARPVDQSPHDVALQCLVEPRGRWIAVKSELVLRLDMMRTNRCMYWARHLMRLGQRRAHQRFAQIALAVSPGMADGRFRSAQGAQTRDPRQRAPERSLSKGCQSLDLAPLREC